MEHRYYRRTDVSTRNTPTRSNSTSAYASRTSYTNRSGAASSAYRGGTSARTNRSGATASAYRAGANTNRSGSSAATPRRSGTATPPSRGTGAPKRPVPRKRRRSPANIIVPMLIGLVALVGIVYVGSAWFISTVNSTTYCSNIYVNGMEISRYSKEEGLQFMRNQIDAQLNKTYTLSWEGDSWTFTAAEFGATMDVDTIMERAWNIGHVGNIFDRSASIRALNRNPIYLEMQLALDDATMDSYLDAIYNQLYIEPQNAEITADLSNPYLSREASAGQELDIDAARMQILSLLETGEGGSVLPVLTLEPSISTETAISSLELIVDYKTDTSARGYNGRFNVRKALSAFYGMIVQPGEVVSFNEVVGPRTEERGWALGTEYIGGGKTQQGYGGGICQASTTLYGALLKSGMTIMFRYPHSMTVAYVDPSIDAAVTDTGSKDLVFCNDTDNPITIYTEVTKEYARVMIYGVKTPYRYELESVIVEQGSSASRTGFIEDTEGTHCYYIDEYELYKKGIPACLSQGYLVGYDWETGEEVYRQHLSNDSYGSGTDIYWRGIHTRDGGFDFTGEEANGL